MSTMVTMTIDTEEEWDWNAGWPSGPPSLKNIDCLPRFQDLCSKYGIATTYFTNHAVLADPRACGVICDLSRRPGVEIGMHIHPWNTPPIHGTGAVRARDTFLHNLPREIAGAKLQSVWDAFEANGMSPTSFRGGRYSSDRFIQGFLRDRGVIADASVLPFSTWSDDGAPDYRDRGLEPVRLPPRTDEDPAMWEVPLTLGFTRRPYPFWRRMYELVERTVLSRLRLIGIAERLGIVKKMWLNFEYQPATDMLSFLELLRPMKLPSVCLTIHSSSIMAGKAPFSTAPADPEHLLADMERVFRKLADWPDFEKVTMTRAAHRLEEDYLARSGN